MNRIPKNTARTKLHDVITFHHANTRGSRVGRLRIAHLCVLKTIVHPRVMCHFLSHLTLTTSTSSISRISSISPIIPTVSAAHTRSMVFDPYLPFDVPRQSGESAQNPSLTETLNEKHENDKHWNKHKIERTRKFSTCDFSFRDCIVACVSNLSRYQTLLSRWSWHQLFNTASVGGSGRTSAYRHRRQPTNARPQVESGWRHCWSRGRSAAHRGAHR